MPGTEASIAQYGRRQINLQHTYTARAMLTPQAHRGPGTSVPHFSLCQCSLPPSKPDAFQSNKLCPQRQHV